MLKLPGRCTHLCEGPSRREFLSAGSMTLLGLNLAGFFSLQKSQAATKSVLEGAKGFGAAKSVILCFLQGGPSHIDIWDPKPDAPSNIRGEFKPIGTKVPGIQFSETMPLLAKAVDHYTLI